MSRSENSVLPTSADLLLDTSAAIALLAEDHPAHERVHAACHRRVLGLAGHALFETYSVLTRLPGSTRVAPATAEQLIAHEFPRSVRLPPDSTHGVVAALADAGIAGGAVYDGLVGLAARAAGIRLLSCDRRARATYAALKIDVELL